MSVQFLVRVNLALVREHFAETGIEMTPRQVEGLMSRSGFRMQPNGWWACAEMDLWMLSADEILDVLVLPSTCE